jgi:hypothetical protein
MWEFMKLFFIFIVFFTLQASAQDSEVVPETPSPELGEVSPGCSLRLGDERSNLIASLMGIEHLGEGSEITFTRDFIVHANLQNLEWTFGTGPNGSFQTDSGKQTMKCNFILRNSSPRLRLIPSGTSFIASSTKMNTDGTVSVLMENSELSELRCGHYLTSGEDPNTVETQIPMLNFNEFNKRVSGVVRVCPALPEIISGDTSDRGLIQKGPVGNPVQSHQPEPQVKNE